MEEKERSAHDKARDLIFSSPELLEKGALSLHKEFRIKDCTIDVLLKGQDGALIVVEVNTHKPESAAWQVRKYRDVIKQAATDVFGVQVSVRGYVVMPHEWKQEKDCWIAKYQEIMESNPAIPEVTVKNVINGFKSDWFPANVEDSGFKIQVKYL